jgi:hypothetical protein
MAFMKAIQVNAPGGAFVLVQKKFPNQKLMKSFLRWKPAVFAMATP